MPTGGGFAGQRALSDQIDIRKNNMSFFNKLKEGFNTGRSELAKQVGRFKNKKFMQGTVAVCARIAIASDGVSSEEK